jgi:hypothetical protein
VITDLPCSDPFSATPLSVSLSGALVALPVEGYPAYPSGRLPCVDELGFRALPLVKPRSLALPPERCTLYAVPPLVLSTFSGRRTCPCWLD